MDKKSKILIWIVVILIIGSVGATYWRIFVKKDYIISNEVDCDPYSEKCFIWECDPASTVEGEACTGDAETDIWYYKIAQRKASNIPLCNPDEDENCTPFVCDEGEKDCSETLCDEKTKVEQKAECNDPVQFAIDNPVEEESADSEKAIEGEVKAGKEADSAVDEATTQAETAAEEEAVQ